MGSLYISSMNSSKKSQAVWLLASIALINISLWIITLITSSQYPVLLSPALLAFSFGLRHAVDADHIAAIDNVTRTMISQGRKPLTIGLYFSLGHSTVVVLLSVAVAVSASTVSKHMEQGKEIGSIIGTLVSAGFLFIIGTINAVLFVKLVKKWWNLRNNNTAVSVSTQETSALLPVTKEEEEDLSPGGFFAKCFPSLFRIIDQPWKMYPLGLLFGLGFDTASEVALLGISAIASRHGIPTVAIILLPLLFTSGMSLIDTADGIMMLFAYGWADLNPSLKIFYNLFLTGVSAMIAYFVGSIEFLGIIVEKLNLTGSFWTSIHELSDNFETLGFCIVGMFAAAFVLSYVIYKNS